ncbi:hypothetical protein O5O45_10085 [Hahella aquimaris]|uniref:hypothetical protein n=1 Tax=Hahella sp. HNIBRBA332 TaxID=3015983 RepID=UPI00273B3FFF|nr:hypothetical protein [Hahella sp. HNIBRBA332]WLQ16264.1 hypothetical protein O5O45_10085 [Hahella sp. HNIBRBA332]
MDLVTFTEGVQSVRVHDTHDNPAQDAGANAPSRSFVPRGESVVQHTEKLFLRHATSQEMLRALIGSSGAAGVDPQDFDDLAASTQSTLAALEQEAEASSDPEFRQTLQSAVAILNALYEDRQWLRSNLSALEKP